jgi:hypothetical protein
VSWLLHASVFEAKLRDLQLAVAVKAGFDPNQARVPAGNPDGRQWTSTGGESGSGGQRTSIGGGGAVSSGLVRVAQNEPPGHLTDIPEERPASARIRHAIIKELAKEAAIFVVGGAGEGSVGVFLSALNLASWVHDYGPFIRAYVDAPKTLDELQNAVSTPARGYDIHHIVEQTPAEQDGFPRSLIDSRENLVRVPTLKHWLITGWFATKNEEFGGVPPRQYLRGKDWAERTRVGRKALVDTGVLKP